MDNREKSKIKKNYVFILIIGIFIGAVFSPWGWPSSESQNNEILAAKLTMVASYDNNSVWVKNDYFSLKTDLPFCKIITNPDGDTVYKFLFYERVIEDGLIIDDGAHCIAIVEFTLYTLYMNNKTGIVSLQQNNVTIILQLGYYYPATDLFIEYEDFVITLPEFYTMTDWKIDD